jgi:hypothetical protein
MMLPEDNTEAGKHRMNERWKEIDQYLESRRIDVEPPTSALTTGGGHANSPGHYSYHYLGLARDYQRNASTIARKLEFIASNPNGRTVLCSTQHLVQKWATP